MFATSALLLGVLLPAVVAALILLGIARATTGPGRAGWSAAAAVGAGYGAGQAGLFGWPAFPARVAEQWLLYLAALGVALVVAESVVAARGPWPRWTARAVLVGAALAACLRPMVAHHWSRGEAIGWIAGLAALSLAVFALLDGAVTDRDPRSAWAVLTITLGGTAVALALSGSLALGQLAGAAAAACGGGFVASLLPGRLAIESVSAPVPGVLLATLLLCGFFYAELPAASALLLAACPAVAWVVGRRVGARVPLRATALTGLAVAAWAAAAVVVAVLSSPPLEY